MTRRLVVGAVIVDALDAPTRVLACRRTRGVGVAGRWEFPGGKVEPGETPGQALVRELGEELAIEVVVGDELSGPGERPWPIDERYELALFLVEVRAGVLGPGPDHDQLRWLGAEELDTVDWLPSDTQALGAVRARLRTDRTQP